jgi:hypothetical protein
LLFFEFQKVFDFLKLDKNKCPFSESADIFLQNPWPLTIMKNYGLVPEKIIVDL